MSVSDHIAILTMSALATPVPNKLKVDNPLEFFALVAFPPEAIPELQSITVDCATQTFGGMHPDVQVGLERNSARKKPIAGIPSDWFIVRATSRFAPEVYDAKGNALMQSTPDGLTAIRQLFYAGKRVRANITAWPWTHKTGGRGVSYNLAGLMDAGQGGDRMAIGNDSSAAFAKHANPNAAPGQTINQSPGTSSNAAAAGNNPFGGGQDAGQQQNTAAANPFAQSTGNAAANPFA